MKRNINIQSPEGLKEEENSAFNAIFLAYYRRVVIFIRKIINSDEDAQELAQEVFIKLWQNKEAMANSERVGSLLFTISKNMAIDYLRKKKVLNKYVENEKHIARNAPLDEPQEVDAQYIELCIDVVVERLSEKQQQIFRLVHTQGLTNEQVAHQLKLSKKTIDNNMALIREKFREIIALGVVIKNN